MPYTASSKSGKVLLTHQIIMLDMMMDFVASARNIDFSVVAQRASVRQGLEQVQNAGMPLRKMTAEMSEDRLYVDLGDNVLNSTLLQITSALSYRDLQKDTADAVRTPMRSGPAVESEKDKQLGFHYNDASNSYYKAVGTLLSYLNADRNLIDKDTLVSKSVSWGGGATTSSSSST